MDSHPAAESAAAQLGSGQELRLVLTSEASQRQAEELAQALLQRRLAACISLLPSQAHYHWQGELESAAEVQLLIKTLTEKRDALHRAVLELHSYTTPMWLEWAVRSDEAYGAWLRTEVLSPDADSPAGADSPGGAAPAG